MLATRKPRALPAGEVAPSSPARWVRIDREDWRRSALAEGFGNLRTSVLFSEAARGPIGVLLVTSVQAGEGKTTVSLNLAISLASLGKRVLLVDADLRRPSLHRALQLPESPGLSEHLAGARPWQLSATVAGDSELTVLCAGGPAEAPAELLSGERMRAFVAEAQAAYDFVVVDSPALMVNVADSRILSSYVDGIVMVVRGGVTPREVLRRLLGHMRNVVGVVLNDLESSQLPSYYHDYRAAAADEPSDAAAPEAEVRRAAGGEA
jgi:capsular exopolysaccharide synthesis family protein